MTKVPIVPVLSKKKIETRANEIVRELYPDAWRGVEPVPVDMLFDIDIPDLLGFKTGYADLNEFGLDAHGYTNLNQKISLVDAIVANDYSLHGERFYRATAGHESGHCFLHGSLERWWASRQILGLSMHRDRNSTKAFESPEWQAWHFCKALTMPMHLVKAALQKYGNTQRGVEFMMEMFNMNYSFVQSRIKSL